ncbi:hypothetical protein SAPIO_CDS0722 [Scedosporium apiospermum]|uniref:ABC transmembrane type-1 domain-containing protein n=1 Tax=Pseudallescheria apiosperma TaxID=563466 RepID=A0A084GGE1_PSEDA|nr:uncharacterized protein SAPIO_CDS0722 [Scedosporium apiospermum]KEZ46403.1 hypothetical protein SAPIO_CDS0722 [Scedosporium apiospermum]
MAAQHPQRLGNLKGYDPEQRAEYNIVSTAFPLVIATAGFMHTGAQITRRIKQRYLEAVLRQHLVTFDATGTGEILSRLNADSNSTQDALSSKPSLTISTMGTLVATIIAMVRYSAHSLTESSAVTSIVESLTSLNVGKYRQCIGLVNQDLTLYN